MCLTGMGGPGMNTMGGHMVGPGGPMGGPGMMPGPGGMMGPGQGPKGTMGVGPNMGGGESTIGQISGPMGAGVHMGPGGVGGGPMPGGGGQMNPAGGLMAQGPMGGMSNAPAGAGGPIMAGGGPMGGVGGVPMGGGSGQMLVGQMVPPGGDAIRQTPMTYNQMAQLKAQIMAYKYLARNQPLPEHLLAAIEGKRPAQFGPVQPGGAMPMQGLKNLVLFQSIMIAADIVQMNIVIIELSRMKT